MKQGVTTIVSAVLLVTLAGCAGGGSGGERHPEKQQRGLDNMMEPSGSPYVGAAPGVGAGALMGPGMSFMSPRKRGRRLTRAEVAAEFRYRLNQRGDGRLKVGSVIEKDRNTLRVELVTQQGYPAARYEVDRLTGLTRRVR